MGLWFVGKNNNNNNNSKEKNKEAPKANSKEYKDLINITHYNVDNLLSKNKKNGPVKTEPNSKNKNRVVNNKHNKKQILNNNSNINGNNKEMLHVNPGSNSNRINMNINNNKVINNNFNERNVNLSNPEELHFYMVNITQNIKEIRKNYV